MGAHYHCQRSEDTAQEAPQQPSSAVASVPFLLLAVVHRAVAVNVEAASPCPAVHARGPGAAVRSQQECIRRAAVVRIRLELDKVTKTVILNNGDKLSDALHLVR